MTITRVRPARAAAVGAVLMLAAALTACGGGSNPTGGSSGTGSSSAGAGSSGSSTGGTASASGSSAGSVQLYAGMSDVAASTQVDTSKWKSDKSQFTIGYSGINLVNSFQVQRVKSAEQVAQQYGAKLVETNANNDAGKQVSDIQDLLAQGVDALVLTPVTTDSLKGVLQRAAQAKIPVIVEGSPIESDNVVTQVFDSNTTFGQQLGQGMCTALKGKGKVVMLRGIAGVQAETERYDAGKQVMQKCGLTVEGEAYGNWSYSGGQKAMQTLAAQYATIDGVWSSGSEMTRAAVDVLKAANRKLVPMTGECENGYLQVWQSNHLTSVAPIFPTWQTPEGVKLAIKVLRGEPVLKQYDLRLPPITNSNLSQYVDSSKSKDWWSDGVKGADGKIQSYLTDQQIQQIFK